MNVKPAIAALQRIWEDADTHQLSKEDRDTIKSAIAHLEEVEKEAKEEAAKEEEKKDKLSKVEIAKIIALAVELVFKLLQGNDS